QDLGRRLGLAHHLVGTLHHPTVPTAGGGESHRRPARWHPRRVVPAPAERRCRTVGSHGRRTGPRAHPSMKRLLVIGIGCGDPDLLTLQAVAAIATADVFVVLDKGDVTADLVALRRAIL